LSRPPLLSLIVATKGRPRPFADLFASLETQTLRDFEVIVVDQNGDDRVGTPEADGWSFPIVHLRTPDASGASRARNAGAAEARGSILLFPDDDCWYPRTLLADATRIMTEQGADILAGRAADATGRDINGRFEADAVAIDRANVWTTGIEWVVFFKRAVFERLGGYDPEIGIGAATPWQSCEAQDIMLRALAAGCACRYDPVIFGHHAELDVASPSMLRKGQAYARGLGYVLRLHGYPVTSAANWILRPAVRAALCLLRGDRIRFAYYGNVAIGRLEGWRMKVGDPKSETPRGGALGLSRH
jgi:glycosyltransferase involved in cell wall biosynthesis